MEETDGYDTPSLTQDLGLGSQSEPIDIQPEFYPEATDPDLGADLNPQNEDQNGEEVLYDCRAQSTEEIEECGVGLRQPNLPFFEFFFSFFSCSYDTFFKGIFRKPDAIASTS